MFVPEHKIPETTDSKGVKRLFKNKVIGGIG